MLKRTFPFSLAVVVMAASAGLAAGLTDRLQAERMTVVRVDHAAGRFLCAEHGRWTSTLRAGLRDVHRGGYRPGRVREGKASAHRRRPNCRRRAHRPE